MTQDLRVRLIATSIVAPENGCMEWMNTRTKDGYGKTKVKGKTMGAHRAAWIAFRGPIPASLLVCHTCDNPCCINPEHLFLGTPKSNMADKMKKGRYRGGPKSWHSTARRGERHPSAKLKDAQVVEIKRLLANGTSLQVIAPIFGVSESCVRFIHVGKTWNHVPMEGAK